ncbi:RNA polymerase subunit sigma [Saccharibacillus sp. O23]|nr:RNA polymerase subunit sigma [Saccharibacillus sp. O23]
MKRNTDLDGLIARTLNGETMAYAEVYEQTSDSLYQTIRFLVGNAEDAQDIVQETYLEAHRYLHRFDRSRPFRPWLMGIALRQTKACRKRRWLQLRKIGKAAQYGRAQEEDFSGQIADRLDYNGLAEQIERLPYKLKQIIVLRYLNDYSQEEMAETLNIPLGTVKSRIHTALERLRQEADGASAKSSVKREFEMGGKRS